MFETPGTAGESRDDLNENDMGDGLNSRMLTKEEEALAEDANVASVTSSPIRHCLRTLSGDRDGRHGMSNQRNTRRCNLLPQEADPDEVKFCVHNANGHFSCKCRVCLFQVGFKN